MKRPIWLAVGILMVAVWPVFCGSNQIAGTRVRIDGIFGWSLGDKVPVRFKTNSAGGVLDLAGADRYGVDYLYAVAVGDGRVYKIESYGDGELIAQWRAALERVYGPAPQVDFSLGVKQVWSNDFRTVELWEGKGITEVTFIDAALERLAFEEWSAHYEKTNALAATNSAIQKEALITKKADLAKLALEADERAAEAGDVFAELQMGKRYRDGDGVAADPAKAREWFAKSVAQGSAQAKKALDLLGK